MERTPDRKPASRRRLPRQSSWLLALSLTLPSRADEPTLKVFADSFITWIYPRPSFDAQPIGYLRAGAAIAGANAAVVRAPGCPGGFQAVEPAGYVCLGRSATLSETRYEASLASLSPSPGPFPFHYALSMGSPAYRRLPTTSEVRRQEGKFGRPFARTLPPHWRGHEELVGGQHPENSPVPSFLDAHGSVSRIPESRLVRREVPFGSMIAVSGAFEHDGRQYLQSADGTIVPSERFLPFRRSNFAGVTLDQETALPLAWTRRETTASTNTCPSESPGGSEPGRLAPATELPSSCLSAAAPDAPGAGSSADRWGVRVPLPLSGQRRRVGKTIFVETRSGKWIRQGDLYVAELPGDLMSTRDKWIHFSIADGTLIAFEGARAVFATLASPGIGGRPRVGGDPLADRTTPLGTFRIQFKHRSDDMSPEQSEHRAFFIADVPHAMFFQPPFAIHVAYWHESFGEPMSGGCINVSPRDGARLFDWTEPPLPAGWHGVGAGSPFGPGTWVRVSAD